jgi:hypothetical protein
MSDCIIKDFLALRTVLKEYEEIPQLITDFSLNVQNEFMLEPKSIRFFINKAELNKTIKSVEATLEKEDLYRKMYGSNHAYYYLTGHTSSEYKKYNSIALTTGVNIKRLNGSGGVQVLEVSDDYIVYISNNSKKCIRIGLTSEWTNKDLKYMLKPEKTNNFSK